MHWKIMAVHDHDIACDIANLAQLVKHVSICILTRSIHFFNIQTILPFKVEQWRSQGRT